MFLILLFAGILHGHAETTIGEWIRGRSGDFRYVTEYNVKKIQRPVQGFPWIEEDCHDDGDRFANWTRSLSYEIVYGGGVSFNLLGMGFELSGERSQTVEVSFERWIHATRGIRARHILHEEYELWNGTTRVEHLREDGTITSGRRTYPFSLSRMNYGLFVKREILEECGE